MQEDSVTKRRRKKCAQYDTITVFNLILEKREAKYKNKKLTNKIAQETHRKIHFDSLHSEQVAFICTLQLLNNNVHSIKIEE